tara:strand:- start:348 stop:737 length:390 start_codon:yes stop_codon:yes gene_type:complete
MKNIKSLFNLAEKTVCTINTPLDYERLQDCLISLSNEIMRHDGETEDIWYIGEGGYCSLPDLIVGAYWHFTEWHEGMTSKSYATLCALGEVFSPHCTSIESEREDGCQSAEVYDLLNDMAKKVGDNSND